MLLLIREVPHLDPPGPTSLIRSNTCSLGEMQSRFCKHSDSSVSTCWAASWPHFKGPEVSLLLKMWTLMSHLACKTLTADTCLLAWGEVEKGEKVAVTGNWTHGLRLELPMLYHWPTLTIILHVYYCQQTSVRADWKVFSARKEAKLNGFLRALEHL